MGGGGGREPVGRGVRGQRVGGGWEREGAGTGGGGVGWKKRRAEGREWTGGGGRRGDQATECMRNCLILIHC